MSPLTARDIILAPVVTEKSVGQIGEKKYTFRVEIGRASCRERV